MKTPLTALGVKTPDEYRERQRKDLARRQLVPQVAAFVPVLVVEDAIRVQCPCGNYPIVDPEWGLACCLWCGLRYENLTMPERT